MSSAPAPAQLARRLLSVTSVSEYEAVRKDVRKELGRIRDEIARGNEEDVLAWVSDGELAGAHRPLRYDPMYGGRGSLPVKAVGAVRHWVDLVTGAGIRTVFVLATESELVRYDNLQVHPDGFIGYLRARGLHVRHLPLSDPAHLPDSVGANWKEDRLLPIQREAASLFEQVEKPVLVFCSGGADRTPPVVAYILTRQGLTSPARALHRMTVCIHRSS